MGSSISLLQVFQGVDDSFDVGLSSTPSPRLYITVSGYSSRPAVQSVMQGIYNAIRSPELKASRLRIVLEDLRLGYENQEYDELYKQTSRIFNYWALNSTVSNTRSSMLAAINELRSTENWEDNAEQDIRDLILDVFGQGGAGFHEFTFLAGNVEEEDLQLLQDQGSNSSFTPTLPYIPPMEDVFRASFINETDQPVFLYKNLSNVPAGRSAARLLVPLGNNTNATATAFSELINAVCAGQFFAALRTREQLGYAVGSFSSSLRRRNYQGFVVQTEKLNGTATLARIQKWVDSWIVQGLGQNDTYLEVDGESNKTTPFDVHYDKIKAGVVEEWTAKYPSLGAKTEAQEDLLLWNADNMGPHLETLNALKEMTRDQFRDLIGEYFGATQEWRAVVLDGEEGVNTTSTISLDGWYVVTEDNLQDEDSTTV